MVRNHPAINKFIKTDDVEVIPITSVLANAQLRSSEIDVSKASEVSIFISHARDDANAFVGAGTEYRVLVSSKSSGDEDWVPLGSYVCGITAPSSIVMDAAEPAGSTVIEIGVTTPAVNDYVFFKNAANILNSEWSKVVAITAGVDFTILHALSHSQGSAAYTIYNQAEKFPPLMFNVRPYKRMVCVVNNNNGTTNRNIVCHISATMVEG